MPKTSFFKEEKGYNLSKEKVKLSVISSQLQKYQHIHSILILIIPIPFLVYGIIDVYRTGIEIINVLLFVLMYSISWIGITVGYHRFFSHKSFKANKFLKIILAIFGGMACQGPLNYWVVNHRRHHQCSDRMGDIHSPYTDGKNEINGRWKQFWHSHVGWTYKHQISNTGVIANDLLKDRLIVNLNSRYYYWLSLGFILPGFIGLLFQGRLIGFWEGMLWGGFVRLFFTYHTTNTITSLTHMWGTKEFRSYDESRNNLWLALITWGESWHNNHHSFPSSAIFGLKWHQLDLGAIFIRSLQFLGMAWDVKKPSKELMSKKSLNS